MPRSVPGLNAVPCVVVVVCILGACREPLMYIPPPDTTRMLHVEVTNGDLQVGTVAQQLPEPIIVRVTDQYGRILAGRMVWFEVVEGNGILWTGGNPTGNSGLAFDQWTLGTGAGPQELVVRMRSPAGDIRTYARVLATAVPDAPIRFTGTLDAPDSLRLFLADHAGLPGRAELLAYDAYDNPIEATVPLQWTGPGSASVAGTEVSALAEGSGWLVAAGDTSGLLGTFRDSIQLRTLADIFDGQPHWTWEQRCAGHPEMQRAGVPIGADSAVWTVTSAEGREVGSGDVVHAETGYGAWDDLWVSVRSGTLTVYWSDGVAAAADTVWLDDGTGTLVKVATDSLLMGRDVARSTVDAARLAFVQLHRGTLVADSGTPFAVTLDLMREDPSRYESPLPLALGTAACAVSVDGARLLSVAVPGRTTLIAR